MSQTRHVAEWRELTGPTYAELGHRDTIDWHYHDVHQIVYPSSGVLAISAAAGTWVVPPQRAVLRLVQPERVHRDVQAGLRRQPGQVLRRHAAGSVNLPPHSPRVPSRSRG
jgi:hypothetical protein